MKTIKNHNYQCLIKIAKGMNETNPHGSQHHLTIYALVSSLYSSLIFQNSGASLQFRPYGGFHFGFFCRCCWSSHILSFMKEKRPRENSHKTTQFGYYLRCVLIIPVLQESQFVQLLSRKRYKTEIFSCVTWLL